MAFFSALDSGNYGGNYGGGYGGSYGAPHGLDDPARRNLLIGGLGGDGSGFDAGPAIPLPGGWPPAGSFAAGPDPIPGFPMPAQDPGAMPAGKSAGDDMGDGAAGGQSGGLLGRIGRGIGHTFASPGFANGIAAAQATLNANPAGAAELFAQSAAQRDAARQQQAMRDALGNLGVPRNLIGLLNAEDRSALVRQLYSRGGGAAGLAKLGGPADPGAPPAGAQPMTAAPAGQSAYPASSDALPKIATPDQLAALSSGSVYVAPDGSLRRKK